MSSECMYAVAITITILIVCLFCYKSSRRVVQCSSVIASAEGKTAPRRSDFTVYKPRSALEVDSSRLLSSRKDVSHGSAGFNRPSALSDEYELSRDAGHNVFIAQMGSSHSRKGFAQDGVRKLGYNSIRPINDTPIKPHPAYYTAEHDMYLQPLSQRLHNQISGPDTWVTHGGRSKLRSGLESSS